MTSTQHRPDKQGRSAPLAAHPAFPAVVALWIATSLIIAAMVVPASLLERAAATIRLDALVPAARPPLGFTARLLLGLVLALSGGAAGYLGALALRRHRAGHSAETTAKTPSARPAEPQATGDDEDLVRLEAARPPLARRRALTSETAEAPSILEISAIPALEALVPGASADPAQAPMVDAGQAPAGQPADHAPAALFRTSTELGGEASARLRLAPLGSLSVIQLVERFALALQARRTRAEPAEPRPAGLVPSEPLARSAPFAEPRPAGTDPAPTGLGRPFDEPAGPDVDAAPPTPETAVQPSPSAELARWTLPEPEGEDEYGDEYGDGDEDQAADPGYGSLAEMRPVTRAPEPLARFVRVEDGPDGQGEAGPQPVVIFPGQAVPAPPLVTQLPGSEAAATPQETEQALRKALAALQRMSGAA